MQLLILLVFMLLCVLPGIAVTRYLKRRPDDNTNTAGLALIGCSITAVTGVLLLVVLVVGFRFTAI